MPTARSRSFSLVGRRSTIRFPYVLPRRTIVMVEIMLSTSFCAVPALRRVEPVTTSGPTATSIGCSTTALSSAPVLHDRPTVRAPSSRARPSAAITNGVRPLAAMPTTASPAVTVASSMARRPPSTSSSAASTGETIAGGPPAMIATTSPGSVPNVGGHSDASSTPRRPDDPAPT